MSNRERINANNASIQACIDKANALPNAGGEVECKVEVEKNIEITENGQFTYTPNEKQVFSSVEVNVNVPIPDGYIQPAGTMDITKNGEYNIAEFEKVNVDVKGGGGEEPERTPSEGLGFQDDVQYPGVCCIADMGTCTDAEVIIPAFSPDGKYVVKYSGNGANEMNVKSIIFPDGIREISYAFGYTPNLECIKFGKFTCSLGSYFSGSGEFASNLVIDFSDFALKIPPTMMTTEIPDFIANRAGPDAKIIVPEHMKTAWQEDSNWRIAAAKIFSVNEIVGA